MPKSKKQKQSPSLEAVQAELAEQVPESIVLSLDRDAKLLRLLSVWHMVPVSPKKLRKVPLYRPENPVHARRDWLWAQFEVDAGAVRSMLGVDFPAERVIQRATDLMLVNPDGTIHSQAKRYLAAASADVIGSFESVKEQRKRAEERKREAEHAETIAQGGGSNAS